MELWSTFVVLTGLIADEPNNPRWFEENIREGKLAAEVPLCGVKELRTVSVSVYLEQMRKYLPDELVCIIDTVLSAQLSDLPRAEEILSKLLAIQENC